MAKTKSKVAKRTPAPVPVTIPEGYVLGPKAYLIPKSTIPAHELLEDKTVRKVVTHAEDLSLQIGRFKGHVFEDVAAFLDVLRERYKQSPRRGMTGKGNITLTSYDGNQRVQIMVTDQLTFSAGLQIAKSIIDDCLREWSADARPELKVLVNEAFAVDKTGNINRTAVFSLLRMDIEYPAWKNAMVALRESIRVIGSKTYIRLQRRNKEGAWESICIDLASASVPEGMAPNHHPQPEEAAHGQ